MRDDIIKVIAQGLNRRETRTITLTPETVTEHDGTGLAVVGADGEPVRVRATTNWTANPGDQILTLRVGQDVWAIGPVTQQQPPPSTGIVASVSGGLVTVTLGAPFGSVAMPSTVTVTSGQRVGIVWHRDNTGEWVGFITGVILTNPAPAPPPPPPPPTDSDRPGGGVALRPLSIRAIATATWRQGWRGDTTNLYQGNAGAWSSRPYPQSGFWFYGAGAFDDHKGHACDSIKIDVRVIANAGVSGTVPVRFRRHTARTRPGGYPTLLTGEHVVNLAPGRHTVTLPKAWGQDLIDDVAAGVAIVATSTAEYRGIHGIAEDAQSGHLTITST